VRQLVIKMLDIIDARCNHEGCVVCSLHAVLSCEVEILGYK